MRRHIERLKQKPEHVRKQVSFLIAGATTALIFTLWIFSARDSFSVDLDSTKSALYEQASPLAAVRDTFSGAFSGNGSTTSEGIGGLFVVPSQNTPPDNGVQVIKMEGGGSADTSGSDTVSSDLNSFDGTPSSPVPYYPDSSSATQ